LARRYVDRSGGLFNPAVLTALKAAGYDKSMDEIRLNGASARIMPAEVQVGDFRELKIDPSRRGIWLPPGMEIDLGGIAKGWIAEKAAGILSEYTTACGVNAGGDLFLIGYLEGETRWTVGIENPFNPSHDLAILKVNPGAVATSSVIKRRWQQEGQARHHLIDPRNGRPAETDWASVTVTAPEGAAAEVFAKVLLMAGSKGADRIAAEAPEMAFVAVDMESKLWGNQKSKELLTDGHFRKL
ncbi:MAG: FAD:protein FMN transferase, partial [Omnitrophica WOR_2 bacterium]